VKSLAKSRDWTERDSKATACARGPCDHPQARSAETRSRTRTWHKLVQQRQDLEHELDPQSCNTLIDCSMTGKGRTPSTSFPWPVCTFQPKGHTPQASPDQSAHFSQCTRAEKGGWKSPPSTTSLTIYKTVTFHLLSPTGEHDTDTQQDRPRRACTITTGSERVFCGTYNEHVTEEDASFKKLSLQKPVSHHSSLGPTPCPLNEAWRPPVKIPQTPNYSELQNQKTHSTNTVQDSAFVELEFY